MLTITKCIQVCFDPECNNCGMRQEGTNGRDFMYVPLGDLLEVGLPVCQECGTDIEWTGDVEVLA